MKVLAVEHGLRIYEILTTPSQLTWMNNPHILIFSGTQYRELNPPFWRPTNYTLEALDDRLVSDKRISHPLQSAVEYSPTIALHFDFQWRSTTSMSRYFVPWLQVKHSRLLWRLMLSIGNLSALMACTKLAL